MELFYEKLKRLRSGLRNWNWNTFGDLHKRKRDIQTKIEDKEASLQQNWYPNLHASIQSLK